MSCPPEWTVGAYVDQGLAPAEVRSIEAHLVGCERCRGLVLALREEARVLTDALAADADPGAVAAIEVVAPARGAALGLPVAIAATALATAVASALFEARVPMAFFSPSSLLGVNEMLFDTVFLLRDRAAGWFELALALGVLGGLAAIATFVTGALVRRFAGTAAALLVLAAAALAATPADALPRLERAESVRIASGETWAGTLAVSCETLEIDGRVVGDVFAFCERLSLRGEVDGNLMVMAREIEIDGGVTGLVIAGGDNLRLEGSVGGSAYLGAERLTVSPEARIARDVFLGGERLRFEGEVGRDLAAGGERVEVEGRVGRDVEAWTERLTLLAGARVEGDLRAHLPDAESLEIAGSAVVGGTTDVESLDRHRHTMWARYRDGHFWAWAAFGLVASFLIGMVVHALTPRVFAGRLTTGREFFVALGIGFAALVLTPIALVLLALTVVGIPAALIGLAIWATGLYLGGIVVAALIGRSLVGAGGGGTRDFGLRLLVGLLVVVVVKHLPFVGGAAGWVIALVGAGLLVLEVHAAWQNARPARLPA